VIGSAYSRQLAGSAAREGVDWMWLVSPKKSTPAKQRRSLLLRHDRNLVWWTCVCSAWLTVKTRCVRTEGDWLPDANRCCVPYATAVCRRGRDRRGDWAGAGFLRLCGGLGTAGDWEWRLETRDWVTGTEEYSPLQYVLHIHCIKAQD
jgi:hypothetical protein